MPPLTTARQWMSDLADEWIGLAHPPAPRVVDEADWAPDTTDAYCRRCGGSVGPAESTRSGCAGCREGGEIPGGLADGVVRLGAYDDPLRAWILAVKFHRWLEMGNHLGRLLGKAIKETRSVDPDNTIVVPAPMPWLRRLYRGVDHARVIGEGVADELGVPLVSMLARANTPPQMTLSATQRRRQGGRGLRLRRRIGGWPVADLHVILVDDVRTTGTTLKAAHRSLKPLRPAQITCAVLAVSDPRASRHAMPRGNERSQAASVAHVPGD